MISSLKEIVVASGNPRCITLTAPPGIRLSDEQWENAAAFHLRKLGYGDKCKFATIKHGDGGSVLEHVHVTVES